MLLFFYSPYNTAYEIYTNLLSQYLMAAVDNKYQVSFLDRRNSILEQKSNKSGDTGSRYFKWKNQKFNQDFIQELSLDEVIGLFKIYQ